jgi:F420-non-reducing hydrogenase small subunit
MSFISKLNHLFRQEKPKLAFCWCSSCGGCEESVLDLAEDLVDIVAGTDIVFWPIALDSKYQDVAALADGEITATLINGAIRMDHQEDIVRLLRRKSKLLIAHGACAHLGGVVGLANFHRPADLLNRAYKEVPTVHNPSGILPGGETPDGGGQVGKTGFYETVLPLNRVVAIDFVIPGCPPPPELVKEALMMVLEHRLPPPGTILGERQALCQSCPRRSSLPETLRLKEFSRMHQVTWDAATCFLAQGIICLGPATRGGCQARCIQGNMPCRGCFGPLDPVRDQGVKSLSFLASLSDSADPENLRQFADSIPDPGGLFYQFSLAASLLKGKADDQKNNH